MPLMKSLICCCNEKTLHSNFVLLISSHTVSHKNYEMGSYYECLKDLKKQAFENLTLLLTSSFFSYLLFFIYVLPCAIKFHRGNFIVGLTQHGLQWKSTKWLECECSCCYCYKDLYTGSNMTAIISQGLYSNASIRYMPYCLPIGS